jgi:hypothetical protein
MPTATKKFQTTVQSGERGRVFVALPFNPSDTWGKKQRHHIAGTVNGMSIRGPLGSDSETHFLLLGAAWRRDCGIKPGDAVTVELWPEGPQQETLAADITAALDAEPQAKAFFESLATFYRTGYLRWIDSTKKKPEMRAARIAEMIELLKAGKKQR